MKVFHSVFLQPETSLNLIVLNFEDFKETLNKVDQ